MQVLDLYEIDGYRAAAPAMRDVEAGACYRAAAPLRTSVRRGGGSFGGRSAHLELHDAADPGCALQS